MQYSSFLSPLVRFQKRYNIWKVHLCFFPLFSPLFLSLFSLFSLLYFIPSLISGGKNIVWKGIQWHNPLLHHPSRNHLLSTECPVYPVQNHKTSAMRNVVLIHWTLCSSLIMESTIYTGSTGYYG